MIVKTILFSFSLYILICKGVAGEVQNNSSTWFRVVEDEAINNKILNLHEYLKHLELKDEKEVHLQNDTVRDFQSIAQYFESGMENIQVAATCGACYSFVGLVALQARQLNTTEKMVEDRINLICPFFTAYTNKEVCTGLVGRVLPTMYYVLKNRPELKVISFCGYIFQQLGCYTNDPYFDWSVELGDIPKRKPTTTVDESMPEMRKKSRQDDSAATTNTTTNLVKIVQLADIHIDMQYQPGTHASCQNNVMCCRKSSESRPFMPTVTAGYHADNHKCDPPISLLEKTLIHLSETHGDINLFYMSGDIVPHNIWSSSIEENTEVIEACSKLIYQYFPNTKILILAGNHEAHPVNMFSPSEAPEEINTRWLYNVTYNSWKTSIPDDQVDNYFNEGSYVVEISKSLKVIMLNTNVCYGFNMWGAYVVKDQGGLLNWLIEELDKSESQSQNVHILGHVPPGHPDCSKTWSRNFYNIISRYHKTVKGQFYGHTHYDEFKLFYSSTEIGVPINALWISPSLTPYEIHNPSYKLFYADGGDDSSATWDILDYEAWIINLDEANKDPMKPLEWFPLYRATTKYNIPNTKVENLGKFVNNMATNKTLFDSFYQHFYKAMPEQSKESSRYRQKQILCGIVRPWVREEAECDRIQKLVDGTVVSIPVFSNYYSVD